MESQQRSILGPARRGRGGRLLFPAWAVLVIALCAGCGDAARDLSYQDPQWKEGMKGSVSFPLQEEVTITVGLGGGAKAPSAANRTLAWLRDRTNIALAFVTLPDSPGDVMLGEMIRAGKLPDIVPESRMPPDAEYARKLFVNVLEFPGLIPNFTRAVRGNEELLGSALSRTYSGGELLSLGTWDPDSIPFAGVLAYRQDLFEAHALDGSSWDGIGRSLEALKRMYPRSAGFGGMFQDVLELMPSWFGSGYDGRVIVYFDPDRGDWFLGPLEDGYREYVAFLAGLNERGLLNVDMFAAREDYTIRYFSTDVVFMAPYRGATGPLFRFVAQGYGRVTDEGGWDHTGKWVSSLPLPPAPGGGTARMGARLFSRMGDGWFVYNQSPRASEALALLDLLYDPEVSEVLALGPAGESWTREPDGGAKLTDELMKVYDASGRSAVKTALSSQEAEVGLPLTGLQWGFYEHLGDPDSPLFRYHLLHDLACNRPGVELAVQPGVRIPREDSFISATAALIVDLQTEIESAVANFAIGRCPMSEYDTFRAQLEKMGAERLLELYRAEALLLDPAVLLDRLR